MGLLMVVLMVVNQGGSKVVLVPFSIVIPRQGSILTQVIIHYMSTFFSFSNTDSDDNKSRLIKDTARNAIDVLRKRFNKRLILI